MDWQQQGDISPLAHATGQVVVLRRNDPFRPIVLLNHGQKFTRLPRRNLRVLDVRHGVDRHWARLCGDGSDIVEPDAPTGSKFYAAGYDLNDEWVCVRYTTNRDAALCARRMTFLRRLCGYSTPWTVLTSPKHDDPRFVRYRRLQD